MPVRRIEVEEVTAKPTKQTNDWLIGGAATLAGLLVIGLVLYYH